MRTRLIVEKTPLEGLRVCLWALLCWMHHRPTMKAYKITWWASCNWPCLPLHSSPSFPWEIRGHLLCYPRVAWLHEDSRDILLVPAIPEVSCRPCLWASSTLNSKSALHQSSRKICRDGFGFECFWTGSWDRVCRFGVAFEFLADWNNPKT